MTATRRPIRAVLVSALVTAAVLAGAPAASANVVEDFLAGRGDVDVPVLTRPFVPAARLTLAQGIAARGWRPADDVPVEAAAPGEPAPAPAPAAAPPAEERPYPFAERNRLELVTPVPHPVYVGFHEAWFRGALRLRPLGEAVAVDNHRAAAPAPQQEGEPYGILRTRGRRPSPTSAVDIQVRPNQPIRAVVTGTVVEASRYRLYGRYPDSMVVIRPDGAENQLVTMLHVTGLRVSRGDRVEAGRTLVAKRASQFPFASQVDRYSGKRLPHVHVEVRHR